MTVENDPGKSAAQPSLSYLVYAPPPLFKFWFTAITDETTLKMTILHTLSAVLIMRSGTDHVHKEDSLKPVGIFFLAQGVLI